MPNGEKKLVRYFRNSAMIEGGEFKCYNCNKTLISKVSGNNYTLELKCPRCDAEVIIKMQEKINADKFKSE